MSEIQYFLFCPRNLNSHNIELNNKIFQSWKEVYSDVLGSVKEPLNPDDFHRSEVIACLQDREKIIGFHLYSVFDLRSQADLEHHYLKCFQKELLQQFRNQGIRTLMSMEYLTVLPEFRSRNSSTVWSEIIIALGLKLLMASPWDGAIGTGRKDLNIRRKSELSGALFRGDTQKMNYACEILMTTKGNIKPHPNQATEELIKSLWLNRKSSLSDLILHNFSNVA